MTLTPHLGAYHLCHVIVHGAVFKYKKKRRKSLKCLHAHAHAHTQKKDTLPKSWRHFSI